MEGDKYHCCATCRHYAVDKSSGRAVFRCIRLGYVTRPEYKFDCWNPSDRLLRLRKTETAPAPAGTLPSESMN